MSDLEQRSSNKILNVLVVVDTEELINRHSAPSKNYNAPTPLGPNDRKLFYLVATNGSAINGTSGTADLNLQANVGDVIRWTGMSESGNFDNSVLVYNLKHISGAMTFSNPHFKKFTKSTVNPAQNTIFPVSFVDTSFWFFAADIESRGTENYTFQFAIYNRPTGGAQQLYGYFQWDPTLTVNN